jgi:hypothetical protein
VRRLGCYHSVVSITEFMFWKLLVLGGLVFVVCFLYAAITGRTLQQDWTARKEAPGPREPRG